MSLCTIPKCILSDYSNTWLFADWKSFLIFDREDWLALVTIRKKVLFTSQMLKIARFGKIIQDFWKISYLTSTNVKVWGSKKIQNAHQIIAFFFWCICCAKLHWWIELLHSTYISGTWVSCLRNIFPIYYLIHIRYLG